MFFHEENRIFTLSIHHEQSPSLMMSTAFVLPSLTAAR